MIKKRMPCTFPLESPGRGTLDSGKDLLIRFDSETGEITGFTILNFSEIGQEIEELIAGRAAA